MTEAIKNGEFVHSLKEYAHKDIKSFNSGPAEPSLCLTQSETHSFLMNKTPI